MAQRPWEVLRDRDVSLEEASEFLRKALKELAASRADKHGSIPCPNHTIESIRALATNLEDVLADKKQRHVFEGTTEIKTELHQHATYQYPFRKLVVRGLAQLMPLYLENCQFGVKLFLASYLMNYVSEFGGVWVAFRKVRLTDDKGFCYDSEKLGVLVFRVDVEVLIFAPKLGHTLIAEVSEIRIDGLDGLVLGSWLMHISADQFSEGAVVDTVDDAHVLSMPGFKSIAKGSSMKFAVVRLHTHSTTSEGKIYCSIEGTLKPIEDCNSLLLKEEHSTIHGRTNNMKHET